MVHRIQILIHLVSAKQSPEFEQMETLTLEPWTRLDELLKTWDHHHLFSQAHEMMVWEKAARAVMDWSLADSIKTKFNS